MANNATPIQEILADLNGGNFAHAINEAFANVAQSVVRTGKKGKVILNFDFAHVGDSNQVKISHKIDFKEPTRKGDRSENETTETIVYVGLKGEISLTPQNDTMSLLNGLDA